eukprot:CAMPEP_0206482064 /NCGR_PEP_ID=MMETSP0324_2-20121206/38612_1 /ASSEMBLY_ACC=CAM_ASM_000836 /TAXON_ID=2866 /ORGANISM="Crypthecodinium cohnii, Strain Seligo" /LENGTH=570 /DNA_ID=CAMNT_0053959861 /DNA_START=67 /DNA_END=1779 /DNA_ORIENTATION=+
MAPLPVSARDQTPLLLSSLLDRGSELQPDNLIVTRTSKAFQQLTFKEHQVKAHQLGSALERWGVVLGDRIGTLLWNSAAHLQCYHAISCMGAVLHTLNLRLSSKDLGVIIEHAKDRLIFVDSDLLALLGSVEASILGTVEQFVCLGADWERGNFTLPPQIPKAKTTTYEDFLATGSPDYQWPTFPETSYHGLCYTSGTTGMPKGAAFSHRSTYLHTLCNLMTDQLGLTGHDVLLPFVPMFHVMAWGTPFMALTVGTRLIFNGKQMDPKTLLESILQWEVSFSNGVPTVWQGVQALIEDLGIQKVAEQSRLKRLMCGGSSPPAAMMTWYWEHLRVEFLQGWGMTETSPMASVGKRVSRHRDLALSDEDKNKNSAKAGVMVPGIEIRIADPDDLDKELPAGTPGEVLLRGPWAITEYFLYDAPEKFHKGWLVTGDVAKLDEVNAVVLTDRSKDVIKSGGEWISSIDLENHIAGMKDVAVAAVVSMPHPKWDERPVAVVQLSADGEKDMQKLREKVNEHCLKTFAKFQLPDDILVWDALPLTSTGKLDKKVVRQKLKDMNYVLPTAAPTTSKL